MRSPGLDFFFPLLIVSLLCVAFMYPIKHNKNKSELQAAQSQEQTIYKIWQGDREWTATKIIAKSEHYDNFPYIVFSVEDDAYTLYGTFGFRETTRKVLEKKKRL